MSKETREKSERSERRSAGRGLEQVAKALKQLNGITLVLSKNLRRSGRHLRSLMDFDAVNRLNAPLKGAKKSSRRRRRTRRRSSARRRTSQRRQGWSVAAILKGLRGLDRLLGQVWKRLSLFFRSRKWSVPREFEELHRAASRLGEQLKGALGWGYEHVLKPLGKWTVDQALPALLEALAKGLDLVSTVLEGLAPLGRAVWDHFLAPLGSFTGELVVGALKAVGNAFGFLTGALEKLGGLGTSLSGFWSGLTQQAAGFVGGLKDLFSFDPGAWLEEHLIRPVSRWEPLLTLKLAFSEGPADLWKRFCSLWERNGAVKTLVSLVQDGWKSVAAWVKERLGGGVGAAVALVQDGWKNVCDWVRGHLGAAVNKSVGLNKDGWSSVAAWVKEHLGGGVSKGVALVKSGWSSVNGWVKDSLGGKLNMAVGVVKGWKGTVSKALGLGKLSTKLQLKLPKVQVRWEGSPIKLPKFSLKWNARGGILDGAQIFGLAGNTLLGGGERGREAVLPLEHNTGWMDSLAQRVARQAGGAQPIVVKVELDGRVVAQSTVRALREQARAGRYPLSELV